MASFSTIEVETLAGGAMGALCGSLSSTADQHQRCTQTERGNTRGATSAHILVADCQPQDWMASRHAGFLRDDLPNLLKTCPGLHGSGLSHSNWSRLSSRTATNCGVSCTMHALPRINSSRNRACKPFARNSLPTQQILQSIADRRHLSVVLSKPSSSAGFKTSWKALTNDEILFDAGSTSHD